MKTIITLFLLIFLAGCVRSEFIQTSPHNFRPTSPNSIQIFSIKLPERPYIEIGMIEVDGPRLVSRSSLLRALKEKAAAVGADAILIGSRGEMSGGAVLINGRLVPVTRRMIQAVAIRWKDS